MRLSSLYPSTVCLSKLGCSSCIGLDLKRELFLGVKTIGVSIVRCAKLCEYKLMTIWAKNNLFNKTASKRLNYLQHLARAQSLNMRAFASYLFLPKIIILVDINDQRKVAIL